MADGLPDGARLPPFLPDQKLDGRQDVLRLSMGQDQKGLGMTDEKKHDDKDRQKVSDEEPEDVAGGASQYGRITSLKTNKKKPDAPVPDSHHHSES
ncbi:MAG: hypothetical protein DSY92_04845 [Planctomycetota bacterium]|nr:MAG: hypothetical protein DSY92_04845 [Planctomycetota bacterium]